MSARPDEWISVLIPVYNRSAFLGECLESITSQTYPFVRIIVYDDGSTDDSVRVARSFPVAVIEEGKGNRGISHARNRLLDLCDTRYAAWQDSDDVSNVYRIEEQYRAIERSGSPIVYCGWRYERGRVPDIWTRKPRRVIWGSGGCLPGSLFDAARCKAIPFDESLPLAGEDIIWRKAVEKRFGPPVTVRRLLYHLRDHPQRVSRLKKTPPFRDRWQLNRKAYAAALKRLE